MRSRSIIVSAALIFAFGSPSPILASSPSTCPESDSSCQEFAQLMDAEQFLRIVETVDPQKSYSPEAKAYIGEAYLMLAGREGNTPEQEELFCRKALEFGATSAYMGLYFINADKDTEAALGYLRQYIETKPNDSVPYVILGESELSKKNYDSASRYLAEARQLSRGRSARIDWLLFQASYLAGDLSTASAMLDSSFSQGKSVDDLKALVTTDQRFSEIVKKNEFRRFFPLSS